MWFCKSGHRVQPCHIKKRNSIHTEYIVSNHASGYLSIDRLIYLHHHSSPIYLFISWSIYNPTDVRARPRVCLHSTVSRRQKKTKDFGQVCTMACMYTCMHACMHMCKHACMCVRVCGWHVCMTHIGSSIDVVSSWSMIPSSHVHDPEKQNSELVVMRFGCN